MSAPGAETCVAHLVRRANDTAAFRGFLESYAKFPAGIPHDLLIIFKGFSRGDAIAPYDDLLQGIPHRRAFARDFGFDIRPYFKVAREHPYRYFAFFNSFSRFVGPGWLEIMRRHAGKPDVGIVGASGSHQSILSDFIDLHRVLPRPNLAGYKRFILAVLRHARYFATVRGRFLPFPNYHVRTNAFMMSRDLLMRVRCGPILRKWDAYHFESGVNSLTQQLISAGLTPLVVGSDGRAYEPAEWPESRTFWIAAQENLLVADNQTRDYGEGARERRERLAFHAWRRWPDGRPRTDVPPIT